MQHVFTSHSSPLARWRSICLGFVLVVTITACGTSDGSYDAADFATTGGWAQVLVTGAVEGTALELVDDSGSTVQEGSVDAQGAFLFRIVDAGTYKVRTLSGEKLQSEDVTVMALDDKPNADLYTSQTLPAPGFGYVETRDGTTLSINVMLPGSVDKGPYPTVVEYSGYAPSNPADTTFGKLFNALGYAYVGVNMRGTGCSGGSFRFFEPMQRLDAYDAIEAIAAQPWVFENSVGMVGISYPGISQLFSASTQPPSLKAITPLSVLDDSYRATLYPGGILNTGFAVDWTRQRVEQSKPYGQGWEQGMVDKGDTTCADNQKIRLQNPDLLAEIDANPYYSAEVGDEISPREFINDITVPVFLAGAWQDEQTGGHFATMLDQFTSAPHVYAYLVNGLHTESLVSTGIIPRYVEFLELYVAKRVPSLSRAKVVVPLIANAVTGVSGGDLGDDRFAGMTYDEALKTYESEASVHVLFEEGSADEVAAGAARPRWASSFASWPIPNARATTWFLNDGGVLDTASPTADEASDSYVADPQATTATFYTGSGSDIWKAGVKWDWPYNKAGTSLTYTSGALTGNTVVIGSGSADLWIQSSAKDTDLEVTVSEIRPDGQEMYVQSGWLRASHRKLDDALSSELRPVHTHLEKDAQDLPSGEWTPVRVEIFPFAHVFRTGSKLRITIDAPGGNRAVWAFRTIANNESVKIARDSSHPSKVVLSLVDGVKVPASYPSCSLRGQPCRAAQ